MRNVSHVVRVVVLALFLFAYFCIGLESHGQLPASPPDTKQPMAAVPRQQTAPPATTRPAPVRTAVQPNSGSISGNVYTNAYFGFSIAFPKGWKAVQGGVTRAQLEKNEERMGKVDSAPRSATPRTSNIPLLTVTQSASEGLGSLQERFGILADDLSNQKGLISATAVMRWMLMSTQIENPSLKYLGRPQQVTIGNHEMWKLSWTEPVKGIDQYAVQYLMVEKKHEVQFILVSQNEATLTDIEPIMRSLKFFPPES
jgi:hypothetical protein